MGFSILLCLALLGASLACAQDFVAPGGGRHEGAVLSVSYSPDGATVLSSGFDKTLKLWDAATGRQTEELRGHADFVFAAAFSPDGSLIASGGGEVSPRIWSAKNGQLVAQLKSSWSGHSQPITALAWVDDQTLLTGSVDSTVKVWNVGKAKVTATWSGHSAMMDSDRTTGTRCSWIARNCRDRPNGGKTCTPAHEECQLGVMAIAVDPNGQFALTGGGDGSIKRWKLPSGRLAATWQGNGDPVLAIAISPDGRKALAGTTGNLIQLLSVETGTVLAEWGGHNDDVTCLAFSPDGRTALSGSRDKTVKLWSVESGRNVKTWTDHQGEVRSVAFSPDGRRGLSAGAAGAIKVRELVEPAPAEVAAVKAPVEPSRAPAAAAIVKVTPPRPATEAKSEVARPPVAAEEPVKLAAAPPLAPAPVAAPAPAPVAVVKVRAPRRKPDVAPRAEPPPPLPPEAAAQPAWSTVVPLLRDAEPVAGVKVPVSPRAAEPAAPEPAPVATAPAPVASAAAPGPGRLAPPSLSAEVSFVEPSGNDALDGGEKAALKVTITNAGPGSAQDLYVTVKRVTMAGLKAPRRQEAGSLAAGSSTTIEVPLEAIDEIEAGQARLELGVEEKNGFDADSVAIEFETRAIKLARLELASVSLGGGGIVRLAAVMPMEVLVKNSGTATAKDVSATLVVTDPDIVISGDTTATVGTLEPGQSRAVSFEFFVKRRYKGANNLPVTVTLAEATGKRGLQEASLRLVMGKTAPSLKVFSVKGKAQPVAAPDAAFEDVDAPPETLAVVDPDAYGVVIGIEKYRQEGIPAVDFAARDAQSVYNYLTRSMGFDPKNVVLLQNDRAARSDMMKYLGSWLKNRVTSEKSRVFIFYAGHGAPDPKGSETYLIPYDGDPSYTEDTAFPVKQLYTLLAKLPTKDVTVALDACFSGAGGRSVIAKGARPLMTAVAAPFTGENTVVLSATSADQISTFYPDGQHGLMTYFLLKGLKGAADADGDGGITTSEIYSYMKEPVEREARKQNVEQVPGLSPSLEQLGERGGRVWLRLK